jgi:hypothetical protein
MDGYDGQPMDDWAAENKYKHYGIEYLDAPQGMYPNWAEEYFEREEMEDDYNDDEDDDGW